MKIKGNQLSLKLFKEEKKINKIKFYIKIWFKILAVNQQNTLKFFIS